MGRRDDQPKVIQVTVGEALALELGIAASEAAGRALRAGGYRPTAEELRRISARLRDEALAAGHALAGSRLPLSDEELSEAVERSALAVVSELLGPAPRAC
ncbi:MAG: hypothetical protein NDI82_02275 [Anaeromyxobacteraceae bacterium]|nr:hypothetical protein [Anaeromyxobacteraceae bacterium]